MSRRAKRSALPLKPDRRDGAGRWVYWAGGVALVAFVVAVIVLSGLPRVIWAGMTGRVQERKAAVTGASGPATFVGAEACRVCHGEQFLAWKGSHHDLAMQVANSGTVLGDFRGSEFEYFGEKTSFYTKGGKFLVRTGGPGGVPTEYEVTHTFGVGPLQQYLVPFPGGRFQALPVAWDSRAKEKGGQRWFHLYPNEHIAADDQLHWTKRYQNWNMMCAECHSTNLRKRYDAATDTYKTTYNEINVSCEACHGAGSKHVEWARRTRPPYKAGTDMGLEVGLSSNWATAWQLTAGESRWPVRAKAAEPAVSNVCAACHARRSTLKEGPAAGSSLEDSYRLSMLTEPLYHADGQQRDEVYVWGSFLQSRMHQKGVTCMDCHEPHSLKTRYEGNALCARCHAPELFDTPKHHFHKQEGAGAKCVSCHMPTQKYMVIHERLDHSIRVPRPDLAQVTGAPDACTMCHADKKPEWAAKTMDGWYPASWRQRKEWGTTLANGEKQGVKALPSLLAMAHDPAMPPIVRATAGVVAAPAMRPEMLPAARRMLEDADPSVRISALGLLQGFDAETRAVVAGPSLSDPVRGVRIEAVRLLADVPEKSFTEARGRAFGAALKECEDALRLNADWPAENVNAGNLALKRGKPEEAIAAFRRALKLDDQFGGAYVNLADVYRSLGRDSESEAELRTGLERLPKNADLHHALGLALVRSGKRDAAMEELQRAASLAPENGRYAYVFAIGLNSAGRVDEAVEVLTRADARHPFDPEILSALISMLRERNKAGDREAAAGYVRRLVEAMPGDPGVRQLLNELK